MDVAMLPGGHLLKRVSWGGGGQTLFKSHFSKIFVHSKSHFRTFIRYHSSKAIKISFLVRTKASKMRCHVHSR